MQETRKKNCHLSRLSGLAWHTQPWTLCESHQVTQSARQVLWHKNMPGLVRAGDLRAMSGLTVSQAQCTLLWLPLHRLVVMFCCKVKGSQISCINNHVIEPASYLSRTINVKLRSCFVDTSRVRILIFLVTSKNSLIPLIEIVSGVPQTQFNAGSHVTEKTMWPTEKTMWPAAAILLAFI